MFRRELIGTYAVVGGGLAIGLYVGIFVIDARPAFLGWIFAGAAGLTLGAFIAAIASGEALIGSRYRPPATNDELTSDDWDEDEDWDGHQDGEPPAR